MIIRPVQDQDIPALARLWNRCGKLEEVLYAPLEEEPFRRKFLEGEGCRAENFLVAEEDGKPIAMLHGVAPGDFQLSKPGIAYLTCILVEKEKRSQGVGTALLNAFIQRMREKGAAEIRVSSLNPVNLSWRVPGTPGHDHNNMPGVDALCAGFPFLQRRGFGETHREVAMYRDLSDYQLPADIPILQARLAAEGVKTGPYDPHDGCEFDGMCDRVGSEYWREVLRTETAAWLKDEPNPDPRFWPDGARPKGPRTLLCAVSGGSIVGFTGPVDRQQSGRGWFTGICTDPLFERRGIATVLFHLLMQAFVREGAAFTTLFTGTDNHAQKIYLSAGLRPVREFALMGMKL